MNRFKSLKSQVAVAVTFVALGLAGIFIQADQAGAQNGPKHEPTTHPVDIVSPLPLPVTVDQLMAVSDAGAIMPPKTTWFEPKLRSGLFVHTL